MQLPVRPVHLIALPLAAASLLFGCGGGDSTSDVSKATGRVRGPDHGTRRRQAGRRPDGARRLGRRQHRRGRDLLPVRATWSPTRRRARWWAYAPGDIDAPEPLLASLRSRRSPTTARRSPTSCATTSSSRRRSIATRDVRADVKYAIERALLPGVANGYAQTYLKGIVGFATRSSRRRATRPAARRISAGITTPDDTTLVIKLTDTTSSESRARSRCPSRPRCRRSTRRTTTRRTRRPTATHQVATGPYMIENNSSGELTGYTPNKEIHLVRNPNWEPRRRLPTRVPGRHHDPGGLCRHRLGREEDPHRQRRGQRRLHRRPRS